LTAHKEQISTSRACIMKIKSAPVGAFGFAASLINLIAFFVAIGWPTSPSALYAQNTRYPFKEYADRKEGIIKKATLVAGEKLLLISAVIENREPLPAGNISSYHLKFYLKNTGRVSIEIWEYDKSYKMEPFLRSYPAGLTKFQWPAEIPQYFDIALKDLFPLAKTLDSGPTTYLPIVFYYNNPELKGQYYSFGFIPLKSIDTLEYKFYKFQSTALVHSGKLRDLKKDQKLFIQWNGKGQNNRPFDSGLYTLVITSTYKPRPGVRPAPPVTTKYQFYHDLSLLER
jgi:hypothetical protein